MKCTDKEWQHCRVEKMGCKGCYHDTISKDKIREKIRDKEIQMKCGCENSEDEWHLRGEIFALQELLESEG